tara:strand:- start:25839 stop:28370 length:2532 start_codon:yes stop_codon:yes gene_type:complete
MTSFFEDENKQVVPLITCTEGNYTVCESTLQWLDTIGEFGVIACAGKYRTGKSFLLNRLASATSNTGFGVGDSVQACTKGLWLYKKVFESHGKKIVFVDTEGIDALDANDTHDVRIFTLALLLSSTFIYNSMGPIDETALQTLSLMTRVTENVKFDSESTMKDLSPHMPKFYWILRDFSLKITNKENNEITQDEYLEQALQSSSDPNKNAVRDAIKTSFPKRTLITLPRPSTAIDPVSQRMEDRLMSLSKAFTTGVDKLRAKLFTEITPMKAQDSEINGKMYAVLCKHYTEVIQTDCVPIIKDSWSLIASIKARDLKDSLVAECTQKLSVMKPKPKESLDEEMNHLKKYILDSFLKKSMKPVDDEVLKLLEENIQNICVEATRRLEINVAEMVEKSLLELEPEIEEHPERLSMIINEGLAKFTEKHDNEQDFIKAWMVAASERVLCRWIPRSLQALSSQRDSLLESKELLQTEKYKEISDMKIEFEESIHQEKIKHSELEQLIESQTRAIRTEENDNIRLRTETITLNAEIRHIEQTIKFGMPGEKKLEYQIPSQGNNHALELQDELSKSSLECAEIKAQLSMEKSNHDKCKRQYKDANERLDKMTTMQAQLEANWKQGIEKLRSEQKYAYEAQKKDFENRIATLNLDIGKIQTLYEKESLQHKELASEKKKKEEKFAQEINGNEKTINTLRESNQKYREQSEQSQSRVLEIHKSMLDDLRLRDERAREQQCKYLKESSEFQQRISDLTREQDIQKHENLQFKRKLNELDNIEIECKKYKTLEKEKDILITQLQTENAELRSSNTEMIKEREIIRKENMNMEGELTLLRAEKQIQDVRKAMST